QMLLIGILEFQPHIEQLVAEIELLKKLHDEEVAELRKQIEYSKMTAELDGDRPDLAVASRSVQEAEKWYKSKFDTLKEHAGKHEEHMKTMKDEITTFHNKVTELQSQIDALRAWKIAQDLEGVIAQMEPQLCETKLEMTKYPQDYQELLHIKLQLDVEITTYRKLLEEEEQRGASFSVLPIANYSPKQPAFVFVPFPCLQCLPFPLKSPPLLFLCHLDAHFSPSLFLLIQVFDSISFTMRDVCP
uniref:IF rod domain-containing protein n=1 Tax=Monopterus albus TaxID=43700 RepID=A0A3Q3JFP6_MONAL